MKRGDRMRNSAMLARSPAWKRLSDGVFFFFLNLFERIKAITKDQGINHFLSDHSSQYKIVCF